MNKTSERNGAEKYDDVYRFRTYKTLKRRAARVAKARGFGDVADIGREGVIKLIEAEEKRLGLSELEDSESDRESAVNHQPLQAAAA